MAGVQILMVPELGHEAGVTGTTAQRPHEHDNHVGREGPTHVDSSNPFCLFLSTERSPFSAYG